LIGGFIDRHSHGWSEAEIAWAEKLLDEQDVDIMAWALGTQPVPACYQGVLMRHLQNIDYIKHPE
jgi:antitoxin CptB